MQNSQLPSAFPIGIDIDSREAALQRALGWVNYLKHKTQNLMDEAAQTGQMIRTIRHGRASGVFRWQPN
jgi:hypothetical protein